ncbi:MAG: hypothetical protein JW929_09260 [Anaerolineales bacterium]|nr:hypothetical protein [Anaerolineales bacterium]
MSLAIGEFLRSKNQGNSAAETAAVLIQGLQEIRESVNRTAEAWEKRDYWVKADAFRRQWSWVERHESNLTRCLPSADSDGMLGEILALGERLSAIRSG